MAENYRVADISLAEFGRKEIAIAETEMPGLMAARDGRPDPDARSARRRRPVGLLQHLLDAGPCRRRHRGEWHAGLRLQGRNP